MPVDPSVSSAPSAHHTSGTAPYVCSQRQQPPARADWSIDFGSYCRTSLDYHPPSHLVGSADPRCPAGCAHKAPEAVAIRFTKLFAGPGAQIAAKMARGARDELKGGRRG